MMLLDISTGPLHQKKAYYAPDWAIIIFKILLSLIFELTSLF